MTAFGSPESGSMGASFDGFSEIVFVSDALLQLLVEYEDPITRATIRDPYKIAVNYFKGRFSFDALTIIPFTRIVKNTIELSRLFYCVKVLRLKKGYYLLDTGRFKQTIRSIYTEKLNKHIKNIEGEKELKENIFID